MPLTSYKPYVIAVNRSAFVVTVGVYVVIMAPGSLTGLAPCHRFHHYLKLRHMLFISGVEPGARCRPDGAEEGTDE